MRLDRRNPLMRGLATLTAGLFLFGALDLGLFATTAQAADPREELTKAEDYFLVADFATALEKVTALIDSGDLKGGALRDGYVLAARCEVGLAHRSSAVDYFCEVLRVSPTWQPDADLYTKDEIEVFEQARTTCAASSDPTPVDTVEEEPVISSRMSQGTPWYKNKTFLLVGGGLVALGVILALSGGGDDGPGDLSDFPPPPGG
jgi:hypothetical protein